VQGKEKIIIISIYSFYYCCCCYFYMIFNLFLVNYIIIIIYIYIYYFILPLINYLFIYLFRCIILEFFLRKAAFRGENELSQLDIIWNTCGTPTSENWPTVTENPWYSFLKPKDFIPRKLRSKYEKYNFFFFFFFYSL